MLGVHCCARAFSSCAESELLSSCGVQASHYGASSCGAQVPGWWAQQWWHVESSWPRDQTHIPCIDRWILIHCASRKVPEKQS